MDRLECANCGQVLMEEEFCPACQSKDKLVLYNLVDRPSMMEGFSITIVAPIQIWNYLPAVIRSNIRRIEQNGSPFELKGTCLVSIFSIAALIEGVFTDYLEIELDTLCRDEASKAQYLAMIENLENKGWRKKLSLAQNTLGWNVQTLESFHIVSLLFRLRDQLAHGKSYTLVDRRAIRDKKLHRVEKLGIGGGKYGELWSALRQAGLVSPVEENASINADLFLIPALVTGFYDHGIKFLWSFVRCIRLTNGIDMTGLLKQLLVEDTPDMA